MGCKGDPKRHIEQLQTSPYGDMNCGFAATAMSVSSQSCGRKNPNPQNIREHTGKTNGQGSNPRDWERGIEWYTEDRFGGAMDGGLRARVRAPGSHPDLRAWLEAQKGVVVGIDYGVYNDTGALSGDPNFSGYHGVFLLGWRETQDDVRQVLSWDSLFDGRRQGIPSGPTWIAWSKMRKAMHAYARACGYGGDDRWYGVESVPGIKTVEPDPPEPPDECPECPDCPPDPCEGRVALARSLSIDMGKDIDIHGVLRFLLDLQGEDLEHGDGGLAERIRLALPRNIDFADEPVGSGVDPVPYEDTDTDG